MEGYHTFPWSFSVIATITLLHNLHIFEINFFCHVSTFFFGWSITFTFSYITIITLLFNDWTALFDPMRTSSKGVGNGAIPYPT